MRHLRLYQAIRSIVKTGSIRKASEYQMISPSALNRAILAFEDEIGVEIFERLPTGVRLSVPGELLYYHLEDHLTRMSDFSDLLAEIKGLRAGNLRLTVSSDLFETILPGVLQNYRKAHPGIVTEVSIAEGTKALLDRDTDLALLTSPQTDEGTSVALFQNVELTARVNHMNRVPVIGVAELIEHTLILPPVGTGTRAAIDQALRKNDIPLKAAHIHPGLYRGLQSGMRPDLHFYLDCGTGNGLDATTRIAPINPKLFAPVQITLFKRREGALPRTAERFVNLLQKTFDDMPVLR